MRRAVVVVILAFLVAAPAPSDLDTFMQQVLARRDDNWKRLQQYVLDEEERTELRGVSEQLVWGQRREYTWYVRDGYFIRSPVRVNGVAIGESERETYEDSFLKRAKGREKPQESMPEGATAPSSGASPTAQNLITQTREPQFISSAYFLQFKFEPGRYALVGHEKLDDRDVLKIEYYPKEMFSDDPKTRTERRIRQAAKGQPDNADERFEAEIRRLMNKVSLVTLWVEPGDHQIVKFTFDNAGLDFLPLAWLARVDDLRASMVMGEAFPGIWLPKRVDTTGAVVLATGRVDVQYSLSYSNYRRPRVTTEIRGAVR